jgi:hypothetical protein
MNFDKSGMIINLVEKQTVLLMEEFLWNSKTQ